MKTYLNIYEKKQAITSQHLSIPGFLFPFCEVGGLTVLHKRNEPNLARGQTGK
jgi:hypothetical protein